MVQGPWDSAGEPLAVAEPAERARGGGGGGLLSTQQSGTAPPPTTRGADMHQFIADPDPSFYFNAGPDPDVHVHTDPYPSFYFMQVRI
jgi:hypothetical protein